MNDIEILQRIHELVGQEHDLRQQAQVGDVSAADERVELQRLDQTLDQCWDLLRQWRARKEYGRNADEPEVRPVDEVEGYLQ